MQRLAVYIDIEGFSALYRASERNGNKALKQLMRGVYEVWSRFTGKPADRLFAHQFSDGFLLLQDDWRPTIDRSLAIAIGLMRYLLNWGFVGRAGIATGDFSDISSLFEIVQEEANHRVQRAEPDGVMTTARVMGDALINAYKVQTNDLSGPLLFVNPALRDRISDQRLCTQEDSSKRLVIDWFRSDVPSLDEVLSILDIKWHTTRMLTYYLSEYVNTHAGLSVPWRGNANLLINNELRPLRSKHQRTNRFWLPAMGFGLGLATGSLWRLKPSKK